MTDGAAVDTDVLLKAAIYRIAAELVAVLGRHGPPSALGLTHLIAPKQLARRRAIRDRVGAMAELARLLAALERIEPDDEEIELAADLASRAQQLSLPLDAGEAQLVAITMMRGLTILLTGDKRAIRALATMLIEVSERTNLVGRLVCFEQALAAVTADIGEHAVRERICAEPDADGAMRLACSCGTPGWDPAQLHEACGSFIGALRAVVGDLLAADTVLV
jgi:hypothetical protein